MTFDPMIQVANPIGELTDDQIRRFWDQTEYDPRLGCLVWTGAPLNEKGYGAFCVGGRRARRRLTAHRVAYRLVFGEEPPVHLTLDHKCGHGPQGCVDVRHLVPETRAANSLSADNACTRNAAKTHCVAGHDFADHGDWYRDSHGRWGRRCIRCERERKDSPQLGLIEIPTDPYALDQMRAA